MKTDSFVAFVSGIDISFYNMAQNLAPPSITKEALELLLDKVEAVFSPLPYLISVPDVGTEKEAEVQKLLRDQFVGEKNRFSMVLNGEEMFNAMYFDVSCHGVPTMSLTNVRIRRAESADLPQILSVVAESFQLGNVKGEDFREKLYQALLAGSKPNFVEYNLPEAECRHYVVTLVQSNEEVVVSTGVLIVAGRSKYAAIFEVATQPSHRRRGYASELLKVMIQEAQKAGAERVYLHASAMGKSVYEKVGFQSYPKGNFSVFIRDKYTPS